MKWFRFYSEFRADTKIKRLPIAHRYAFVILLCLANEDKNRGCITSLDDEDIAFELEMELEDWQTLKAKFKVKGFINMIEGGIKITSWDKRQFASDSSAERVKRHRQKKKERDCNVTETSAKRDVTPSEQSRADPDTDPEKIVDPISTACSEESTSVPREENELDSGVNSSRKSGTTNQVLSKIPQSMSEAFESFWKDYCKFCKDRGVRAGSKKPAAVEWVRLVRSGFNGKGIDSLRKAYGLFRKLHKDNPSGIPHAQRFLYSASNRSGLWEDLLEQEEASKSSTRFDSPTPTNTAQPEATQRVMEKRRTVVAAPMPEGLFDKIKRGAA